MQLNLQEMDRLAESFFEAAVRPEMWRLALHQAGQAFGAEGACLQIWPFSEEGAVWSEGLDEMVNAFFAGGWHGQNIRISRAIALRSAKPVVTQQDLFTAEELDKLPFNAEFINPQGFRWTAGCLLGGDLHTPNVFSLERKAVHDTFQAAELAAMTALFPHLRHTVEVASRLMAQRDQGMLDAFEAMSCPAILIDSFGRVQNLNPRAHRLLGEHILVQQGHLITCHKEANSALQQQLAALLKPVEVKRCATEACSSARSKHHSVTAIMRQNGRPLFVYGIPIVRSAQELFRQTRAILVLIDPDEHLRPCELILRHGFKLTPAETRLALAIGDGCSLTDYAAMQEISVGTVRIQLKQVMAKTGTHRQAELVSLLAQIAKAPAVHDS